MYRLPLIIVIFVFSIGFSQTSPHGETLKYGCEDCHTSDSWYVKTGKMRFNHDLTDFKLTGQHKKVECRACHGNLIFKSTPKNCSNCHNDIHQNTTSYECETCHNAESWLVKNINDIHNKMRFPVLGVHQNVNCNSCHLSYNQLRFEIKGINCVDCHKKDYEQAKNPNHLLSKFSLDCTHCHSLESKGWRGKNFTHTFFPLVGGHSIQNCFSCHNQSSFAGLDKNCKSCHQKDYDLAQNPNHRNLNISTNCEVCHTINGWSPARFDDHDNIYFPIYTGKHRNKWNVCTDCHTDPNNYSVFSCINCHKHRKSKMDEKHRGVNGYVWESNACYNCHPTGKEDGTFNNNNTQFPLID